jgi:SAM-dependent methyltransferase
VHAFHRQPDLAEIPVVRADVTTNVWAPDTFDFINVSGVLQHTRDPGHALRCLVRALRPGGALFASLYPRPETWKARAKIRAMSGLRSILSLFPTRVMYRFTWWSVPFTRYWPLTAVGRMIFLRGDDPEWTWILNFDAYIAGFQGTYAREEALGFLRAAGLERITEAAGRPNNFLAWKPAA